VSARPAVGWSGRSALPACLGLLALAACADEPVQLAPRYTPTDSLAVANHPSPAGRAPCRVLLAVVQDMRDDPQAAGTFSERFVHAEDAPAWLRSGLLSISRDTRLDLSDQTPPAAAELVIKVDLLKLYMLPINEAKSANVVIRVHYAGPGALSDEQVYRGAFTSLDWTGAGGEARGAFDVALSKVLEDVDRDLVSRCTAIGRAKG